MGVFWKAILLLVFVFLAVFVTTFVIALIKLKKGKYHNGKEINNKQKQSK